MSDEKITAFKGFDSELRCRGFQYEVGKTYEYDGNILICRFGFHAVENPLDVWGYYEPVAARYALVECSGDIGRMPSDDTKFVSSKIAIKEELTLGDFIRRAVDYQLGLVIIDATVDAASGDNSRLTASGDNSQLAASGDSSQLAASGHYSQLAASGDYSRLTASGDSSQLAASGDYSRLTASGDSSRLAASGDHSRLAVSGDSSQLAASGDSSRLAASGDSSQLAASGDSSRLAVSGDSSQLAITGQNGVIAAAAPGCIAKGAAGTWISLAEFDGGQCIGFVSACVGQNGIKPDTFYRAENGVLVEVKW